MSTQNLQYFKFLFCIFFIILIDFLIVLPTRHFLTKFSYNFSNLVNFNFSGSISVKLKSVPKTSKKKLKLKITPYFQQILTVFFDQKKLEETPRCLPTSRNCKKKEFSNFAPGRKGMKKKRGARNFFLQKSQWTCGLQVFFEFSPVFQYH